MKRECKRGFEECPFTERFLKRFFEWGGQRCPFGYMCDKKREERKCDDGS